MAYRQHLVSAYSLQCSILVAADRLSTPRRRYQHAQRVEASEHPTVFYTDHGAALGIAKQISLSTTSTDKLNLCLI